jgi:GNAT superfamily N-acetyltransferase
MIEIGCEDVKCSAFELNGRSSTSVDNEPRQEGVKARLRFSNVRDYKDRFILRSLQSHARKENPGFLYLIEGREKARLVWSGEGGAIEPVGYYIFSVPRHEFSRYAHGMVQFPKALSQMYVREEHRRRGVATRMVKDFISHCNHDPIWVESPKQETKALLRKLGYFEPNVPYEMWQMMEGLSRWIRVDAVVRARVPTSAEELRVWCGDDYMVLEDLR